jgi:hypothetical protein
MALLEAPSVQEGRGSTAIELGPEPPGSSVLGVQVARRTVATIKTADARNRGMAGKGEGDRFLMVGHPF